MAAARSEKIGYGLGDMSSSMFWKIFSYYLPFFYSNIFGLSLEHAAVLLLVTKLWDAVSDPVMGLIADRTTSRVIDLTCSGSPFLSPWPASSPLRHPRGAIRPN